MTLGPGDRLGVYEIVGVLGVGGMGVVYRAVDTVLRRPIAIKILTASRGDPASEILHEARALSALNHPHIGHVYQVGEVDGQPFIAMELVDGRPLRQAIPADGLPTGTVLRYGTQLADALAQAHEHGIIHRDLKSANIVLTPEGRVKVLDFGLAIRARADVEANTRTGEGIVDSTRLAGTLPYMAPEVLRGGPPTHGVTSARSAWCSTRWRRGGSPFPARPDSSWSLRFSQDPLRPCRPESRLRSVR